MLDNIALTIAALGIGIFLALAFAGLVHALGVALVVVGVIALLLILAGVLPHGRR
jgi:hypothetical protein